MGQLSPFRPMQASASIFIAAVLSVLLYALFDVRWWPRIGHQDLWRGITLAFLHLLAIVQYPIVYNFLYARGFRR